MKDRTEYMREYGKIERKGCELCGSESSQAHHRDYSEPLDVQWLCQPCHATKHYEEEAP